MGRPPLPDGMDDELREPDRRRADPEIEGRVLRRGLIVFWTVTTAAIAWSAYTIARAL